MIPPEGRWICNECGYIFFEANPTICDECGSNDIDEAEDDETYDYS